MATIAALRDGLQTRLATITGLTAYDVWPDTIKFPCAIAVPRSASYDEDQSGGQTVMFEIALYVGPVASGAVVSQDALDPYLATSGTYSVVAAVEAAALASGTYATVKGWHDYRLDHMANGVQCWGVVFDVEVYA